LSNGECSSSKFVPRPQKEGGKGREEGKTIFAESYPDEYFPLGGEKKRGRIFNSVRIHTYLTPKKKKKKESHIPPTSWPLLPKRKKRNSSLPKVDVQMF